MTRFCHICSFVAKSLEERILSTKGRANLVIMVVNNKVTSVVYIKITKLARARGVVA